MKVTQLSVFLENKKGRLYDAACLLGKAGIDIKALTIAESEDFGVLRLVVNKPDEALEALKAGSFVASITDIVAVEIPDQPGGLAAILKILNEHDINLEYMYAFGKKNADKAIMVFRFDEPDRAIAVLTGHSIRIVSRKDVQGLS